VRPRRQRPALLCGPSTSPLGANGRVRQAPTAHRLSRLRLRRDEIEQLLLVYTLIDNPIHCFQCKGVVDPKRLALSESQVDAVAGWQRVFAGLYELWLDSGEYEAWAKEQLLRRDGEVNIKGIAASAALSETRPTFYWWFHFDDDPTPASCPWCSRSVTPAVRHGRVQCNSCRIVI